MKVLFVYTNAESAYPPAKPVYGWEQIHLGISYLSAWLLQEGHETDLVVIRRSTFKRDVDTVIRRFRPDVVAYTSIATEFEFVRQIAKYVRYTHAKVFQVIGGVHASLRPDEMLQANFDAVCIGEGEEPLVELLQCLAESRSPDNIQNIRTKQLNTSQLYRCREWNSDLDSLPFPDRQMWQPWVQHDSCHTILLGRGCPYNCPYCCNHALRELAPGKYFRLRSPENVLLELQGICRIFPDTTRIYFEVETISTEHIWAMHLCHLLADYNASRRNPLKFGVNIRVLHNRSLAELFREIASAGFDYVNIGIESGSRRVRKEIMKRNIDDKDIMRTFSEARAAGLRVFAFNMIGIPGETIADFRKTIAMNRLLKPDYNHLSLFYPYPGTELHRTYREQNVRMIRRNSLERFTAAIDTPEFPAGKINHAFRMFEWYVYRGSKPKIKILANILWRIVGAFPRLYRLLSTVVQQLTTGFNLQKYIEY